MFVTRLPYFKEPVLADSTIHLWLPCMDQLIFLHVWLYFAADYETNTFSYYGTISLPLGEEFLNITAGGIEFERRLVTRLTDLGLVRGRAAAFPVSEVDH